MRPSAETSEYPSGFVGDSSDSATPGPPASGQRTQPCRVSPTTPVPSAVNRTPRHEGSRVGRLGPALPVGRVPKGHDPEVVERERLAVRGERGLVGGRQPGDDRLVGGGGQVEDPRLVPAEADQVLLVRRKVEPFRLPGRRQGDRLGLPAGVDHLDRPAVADGVGEPAAGGDGRRRVEAGELATLAVERGDDGPGHGVAEFRLATAGEDERLAVGGEREGERRLRVVDRPDLAVARHVPQEDLLEPVRDERPVAVGGHVDDEDLVLGRFEIGAAEDLAVGQVVHRDRGRLSPVAPAHGQPLAVREEAHDLGHQFVGPGEVTEPPAGRGLEERHPLRVGDRELLPVR